MDISVIIRQIQEQAGPEADTAVVAHLKRAVYHLEIAAEIEDAILHGDFAELLDAVHREAGITTYRGYELGGGG